LGKLELKINKLKEKYNFNDLLNENIEEELRNIIIKEEKNKETIERLNENRQKIENDNKKYKIQIEKMKSTHIEKFKEIREQNILENIIKENEEKIKEVENKKELCTKKLEDIQKYKNYITEKEKYESFRKKINILEEEEIENKKRYTAALTFREKILEAESIAMHNIIESINTHAQVYLDYFFVDNPIIVKLLSFKETKKNNKPQINIEIDYKGMECDLTSLSGGEISRVVLGFTLALSEMFNSPMLLLDECTASLDQELTTAVFDCIKENMKDKMVIIIAHQVVNGVFDKIINL
jgi:DNA repair exonuclease SbcCD ATPase subunit